MGAIGYTAERGIEYLQTGTFEWDWGQFGLFVGIGAAAGAAGGYLRWRSLQKPTATPVKGNSAADPIEPPGSQGAPSKPKWWNSPDEAGNAIGKPGKSVPDLPNTPGRNKVSWDLGMDPANGKRVTLDWEAHPYLPDAAPWKQAPHWEF